jgi:hypothetical protein
MTKDEHPPSKEALIKAREWASDELVRTENDGGLGVPAQRTVGQAVERMGILQTIKQALDAQLSLLETKQEIKACDVISIIQRNYKSAQNKIKHLKEKRAKSLLKIKELKDALDAEKKLVKACSLPKIEGLGEAIHDLELLFDDIPLTPYGYELYEPVLQAARAYAKLMEGK